MEALVYHGPGQRGSDTVDDSVRVSTRDAVVVADTSLSSNALARPAATPTLAQPAKHKWPVPAGTGHHPPHSPMRSEAFDRGDLAAGAQFLAPEVEWDWDRSVLIDEEAIQGRAAVREYWERILATSPFAHEDHQFLEADDRVCVLANLRLKGAGSGVERAQPCGYGLTLRRGAIVRSLFYFDQSRARQAVGLKG